MNETPDLPPECVGALPAAGLSRRALAQSLRHGPRRHRARQPGQPARLFAVGAGAGQDRGILGGQLHFPPKAKRVIYLFMAGGPSQMETFDYKPLLNERNGEQLPDSVRQGQRLTGMSGNQASLPLAGSQFEFSQHGANGTWVSDLLPHTAKVVDDLCIVRSMYTEAINHDPAITFFQTGSQIAGRPEHGRVAALRPRQRQREPAGVRRADHAGQGRPAALLAAVGQRLPADASTRACSSGAARSRCSTSAIPTACRARAGGCCSIGCASCTRTRPSGSATREIDARIAQYEMAYRMQASVPGRDGRLERDRRRRSSSTARTRGRPARSPPTACWPAGSPSAACGSSSSTTRAGTSTATCRATSERQCQETDQASAALVTDLKRAACSTTRWSSGAASSAARATRRAS